MAENTPAISPAQIAESIEAARRDRQALATQRTRITLALSVAITIIWLAGVTAFGQWDRVAGNWVISVTMVFASFAGGALPQVGSGAISFPVLTKALEVPAEVARSFALCIQAVGVGAASFAVIVRGRPVDWRVVGICGTAGIIGLVIGAYALTDADALFNPSILPGPYVRVSFTLLLGASAFLAYLGMKARIREVHLRIPGLHAGHVAALIVGGLAGGLISVTVGGGAGLVVYLFVVLLFGLDPRSGIPSSLIVMWIVSVAGLVVLGIGEGHLFVQLSDGGQTVTEVGGMAAGAVAADRFDVLGFWLAAVPVVAWGAPLGAYVASRIPVRQLVMFAIALAAIEVITTLILLDQIRSDAGLMVFSAIGAVVVIGGLYLLVRYRQTIFRLAPFRASTPLTRSRLEVSGEFVDDLRGPG